MFQQRLSAALGKQDSLGRRRLSHPCPQWLNEATEGSWTWVFSSHWEAPFLPVSPAALLLLPPTQTQGPPRSTLAIFLFCHLGLPLLPPRGQPLTSLMFTCPCISNFSSLSAHHSLGHPPQLQRVPQRRHPAFTELHFLSCLLVGLWGGDPRPLPLPPEAPGSCYCPSDQVRLHKFRVSPATHPQQLPGGLLTLLA